MNARQLKSGFPVGSVPGQYAGGIEQAGADNLREFVRAGGTLVAFNGAAAAVIPMLSLPVRNVLAEMPSDKFYCAGALLRIESQHPELPINYGVPASPIVMFERGPAFETLPGFKGAVLARYPRQDDPLESGQVVHSEVLADKIAALEVSYGRGRVFLYGFKPQHRGQAHGTYRYLFNALYQFEDPPFVAGEAVSSESAAKPSSRDSEAETVSAAGDRASSASRDTSTVGRRRSVSATQP